MKIELHVLQNFPPSCLNRDDTNSPKDCEFGGVRRARISSQSLKRAMREYFRANSSIAPEELTVRTKRLVEFVTAELQRFGHAGDRVPVAIERLLQVGGLALKKGDAEKKTEYLLFLPRQNLVELATLAHENWAALIAESAEPKAPVEGEKKKTKKQEKAEAKDSAGEALGKELGDKVKALLFGAKHAPELALFGRMIADAPEHNIDAACQVAHALSTHRVSMEFDFYTAVDDLKPTDNQGADMMGTTQFNSACFYKYYVVDVPQLARTLAGTKPAEPLTAPERTRARDAVLAWVDAVINAVPSARQNGMAAWTRPSLVLASTRTSGQPLSLANAFVKPVRAGQQTDLVEESTKALAVHLADVSRMYGSAGVTHRYAGERESMKLPAEQQESVVALLAALGRDLDTWTKGNP